VSGDGSNFRPFERATHRACLQPRFLQDAVNRLGQTVDRRRDQHAQLLPKALARQTNFDLQAQAEVQPGTTVADRWESPARRDQGFRARQKLSACPRHQWRQSTSSRHRRAAWHRSRGGGEALIRTSLKTLLEQLDPAQFRQVHRAVVVNMDVVREVTRDDNETADLRFRHRAEVLRVSRTFLHLFKAEWAGGKPTIQFPSAGSETGGPWIGGAE